MSIVFDIFNYIFVAIFIGVSLTWIFFIRTMLLTFRDTPYLDKFEKRQHENPMVSVIVPARNEEKLIAKCLDSLLDQDYENYEIIAIDDSSDDATADIIKQYAQKNSKIVYVSARKKPDGWIGKNWACVEGYKKATGQLLLFTDSDTKHSQNVLSLAVSHLLSLNLDALTVIPKMLCLDRWTKITLPAISTFLHTRFSALRVNDPTKKTGYFFGSFYLIKNETYRSVGTHEGVKSELIEDGALGKKVKEAGFRMRMARGEHLVEAVWARDFDTLWNALKRLIIPLYLQTQGIAVGIFFAILFLLFMPFPFLVYSAIFFGSAISVSLLFAVSFLATILIYVAALVETKGLQIKQKYALLWPVGSFIVICGFLSGILQAKSKNAVSWRGREYAMKNQIQDSISV